MSQNILVYSLVNQQTGAFFAKTIAPQMALIRFAVIYVSKIRTGARNVARA